MKKNLISLQVIALIMSLTCHLAKAKTINKEIAQDSKNKSKEDEQEIRHFQRIDIIGDPTNEPGYNVFSATSATKTDTPLMEVPQSIQVISNAVLVDLDQQTLSGAIENISSVVAPKSTELLTSKFVIRGFKSQFYLDSMPAFGQANVADPLSLVNVERIDVVKGPLQLFLAVVWVHP